MKKLAILAVLFLLWALWPRKKSGLPNVEPEEDWLAEFFRQEWEERAA